VGEVSSDGTPEFVAIDRLQHRYADIVTRRAWPEMPGVFEPGCAITLDLRTGEELTFRGGEAIATFIEAAIARFDFFVFAVINGVVDGIDVAAGRASGRVYICEHRHDPSTGTFSQAFGLYRDDYHRSPEGWRFARRRYSSLGRSDGKAFSAFALPDG
jgi:hypothetical protein